MTKRTVARTRKKMETLKRMYAMMAKTTVVEFRAICWLAELSESSGGWTIGNAVGDALLQRPTLRSSGYLKTPS